jgi:hypothetical protein
MLGVVLVARGPEMHYATVVEHGHPFLLRSGGFANSYAGRHCLFLFLAVGIDIYHDVVAYPWPLA